MFAKKTDRGRTTLPLSGILVRGVGALLEITNVPKDGPTPVGIRTRSKIAWPPAGISRMLGGKGLGNRRAKGFCVEISVIESVAVPGLEIVTVTGVLRLFRAVGAKMIGLGETVMAGRGAGLILNPLNTAC